MDMNNKEQVLYFFLQGKISLSQYDYKFMANLQTMIQNKNRVTTNQAELFDHLISKYKKQLTKNGYDKDTLKSLSWKTMVVESTSDYTGATVSMLNDDIIIRVPFNKGFITAFRNSVFNNPYDWNNELKLYKAKFSTTALKIAATFLPHYFSTVKYCDEIEKILNDLENFNAKVYNPTLFNINDRLVVGACNYVLGEIVQNMNLNLDAKTLFKMSQLGITVDESVYKNDPRLEFASKRVYEAEITQLETVLSYMKDVGCGNVIIGRGLRNILNQNAIDELIAMRGMQPMGPMSFGTLPDGVNILIQHTTSVDVTKAFSGKLSKIVVLKDSRPIEVK
jgi:hypothetical protein